MTTVQFDLPDQLAEEAQRAGLLASDQLEKWLKEQLQARNADQLFFAMDRIAAVDEPQVMSPEEIAKEIAAMRAKRRLSSSA